MLSFFLHGTNHIKSLFFFLLYYLIKYIYIISLYIMNIKKSKNIQFFFIEIFIFNHYHLLQISFYDKNKIKKNAMKVI